MLKLFRLVFFAIWSLGHLPLALLLRVLLPQNVWGRLLRGFTWSWSSGLLWAFGVRVCCENFPRLPAGKTPLVIANHRSPLDIALLLKYFGGHVVSRADLAHWPIIGITASMAGTIFVDRTSRFSGMVALRKIRDHLEHGRAVILFAEGGTSSGDTVLPFHEAAFAALDPERVVIQPVGLAYEPSVEFIEESFAEHLRRVAGKRRFVVGMAIGQTQMPQRRASENAKQTHEAVQALVHRARALLTTNQCGSTKDV